MKTDARKLSLQQQYAFMGNNAACFSVKAMCRVMGVARSGY